MLTWLRGLSLRRKLTVLVVFTTAVALSISSVAVTVWDQSSFRGKLPQELSALGNVLATNVESALDFQDDESAAQTLAALSTRSEIVSAAVYDSDGAIFAVYEREGVEDTSAPEVAGAPGHTFSGGRLQVFHPMMRDGQPIGMIYLESELTAVSERLKVMIGMMLLVLTGTVLLSSLLATAVQGLVTRPILALVDAAKLVTIEGDYTVRVQKETNDEVGTLIDAFNTMVGEIQQREQDLKLAHEHLEQRVKERTRELKEEVEERRKTEAALRIAKDAAEAAALAKSEFLATMSHEIRTPMNGVLGMTELVLDSDLTPEQRENVEIIHASGGSLLRIINDILDFSKVDAGKLTLETIDFGLHTTLEDAVELLTNKATEQGLSIACSIAPDVPKTVAGDPTRVRQVLLNLFGNAIKFTEVGEVSVIVDVARDQDPDIGQNGDGEEVVCVRVRVRDTGVGMSPATLEQLFTPFVQADSSTTRKFGGTGLGLTISKRLAELMGGTIEVESTLGEGSCFTFILPVIRRPDVETDQPSQATGEGALATLPSADGARILLAEDNKVNQLVVVKMLEKWGYTVDVVENGQQAVEAVERDHYDAVLMDCQMPVMDGYDATRSIRKLPGEESNIPIIAMTANAMQGDQESCIAAGMDDYVTKPFNSEHLASVLAQWSGGRRAAQPVS